MAATPEVRPVGDLPNEIGKTAARELSLNGSRVSNGSRATRGRNCWPSMASAARRSGFLAGHFLRRDSGSEVPERVPASAAREP
jgi:hypothetical protein